MRCKLLLPAMLFLTSNCVGQTKENAIHLNQLGFYPDGPKVAVVSGAEAQRDFYLLSSSGDTVFRGRLSDTIHPVYSSAITRLADFSDFRKTGNYRLYVRGIAPSYPFRIAENVHRSVAVGSLKAFYFMRVSMPLEEKYAGQWARPAGHPDTAVLIHPSAATEQRPAGTVIASPGGWYDAGDYNKYIVNSGITMGALLSAYEDFPRYFSSLDVNIPESKDRVSDLIDEVLYNLRWMLTMQDPHDGGVYNKCTNADFDGMVMPGVTTLPRYVVQKSTAATLDFAAVTAQAARVLRGFSRQLPGLADSCVRAAEAAWQWALQHPAMAYNQNAMNQQHEPKINTGGYGDRNFSDEWFWAAAELAVTTGNAVYMDTVVKHLPDPMSIPTWNSVYMLGYYSLLRNQRALEKTGRLDFSEMKARLIRYADELIANGGDRTYATIMGQSRRDFVWGSSSVALNQSIVLINAYNVSKRPKYLQSALTNFDYVLGRNATGYCLVTGMGSKSPMHPHHRPSVADGIEEPVPGLLSGGPNPGQQDRCAGYPSNLPAESFIDHDCSYASNEIAINWNAPLVYVANAMEVLMRAGRYKSRSISAETR